MHFSQLPKRRELHLVKIKVDGFSFNKKYFLIFFFDNRFNNLATCQCPVGFIGQRCEQQGTSAIQPTSSLCANMNCLNQGR
jgi:hypothetical protein